MSKATLIRSSGVLLMIVGVLFLLWWILMGVLLPITGNGLQLSTLVLDKDWIAINIVGLIGSVILPLGLVGLYLKQYDKIGVPGFVGFILTFFGSILYACVQFGETFIWQLIAEHAPILLEMEGPLLSNSAFFIVYTVMGVLFVLGFILVSIVSIVANILPRIASIFLLIGSILFGAGMFLPLVLRTIGMTLFSIALCWLGFAIFKDTKTRREQRFQQPKSSFGGVSTEQ